MSCGRCGVAEPHRSAREHGLTLCGPCFREVVEERLGAELHAWERILEGVEPEARRLPWNDGRWEAADQVGLEEGFVKVDLHGLDARLADEVTDAIALRLGEARVQGLRVIVGRGGKGVLRDTTLQSIEDHVHHAVEVVPGNGWLDVVWGERRVADVVAEGEPSWRDGPRPRRRAPRPPPRAPRPPPSASAWTAGIRMIGRLLRLVPGLMRRR